MSNVVVERTAPESARTVTDLLPFVAKDENVLFKHTVEPDGSEPYFFNIAALGEYINWGIPKIEYPDTVQSWLQPRPPRRGMPEITLASMDFVRLSFGGDLARIGDLTGWGGSCHVLSERLHDHLAERDPAFESRLVTLPDKKAGRIAKFYVIRPTRVIDAVDVTKSDISIKNERVLPESDTYLVHVHLGKEYSLRPIVPDNALTFVEEYSGRWLWRYELLQAAKAAGFHGFYAVPTYRRTFLQQMRFPGPLLKS